MAKAAREESQKTAEAGAVAEESLSCIPTVTAFNGQSHAIERYAMFAIIVDHRKRRSLKNQ